MAPSCPASSSPENLTKPSTGLRQNKLPTFCSFLIDSERAEANREDAIHAGERGRVRAGLSPAGAPLRREGEVRPLSGEQLCLRTTPELLQQQRCLLEEKGILYLVRDKRGLIMRLFVERVIAVVFVCSLRHTIVKHVCSRGVPWCRKTTATIHTIPRGER